MMKTAPMYVSWQIDTWSFGAVLSETLVWCALGAEGLSRYRRERASELSKRKDLSSNGYGTCFHDGETALKCVIQLHKEALSASAGHPGSKFLIKGIIQLAEDMLTEKQVRPGDDIVYKTFTKLFRTYEDRNDLLQEKSELTENEPRRDPPRPRVKNMTRPEAGSSSSVAKVESNLEHGQSRKGKERALDVEVQIASNPPPRVNSHPSQTTSKLAIEAPQQYESDREELRKPRQNGQVMGDTPHAAHDDSTSPAPPRPGTELSWHTISIQTVLKWIDEYKNKKDSTAPLPGHEQLQQLKGRDKVTSLVSISDLTDKTTDVHHRYLQLHEPILVQQQRRHQDI